MSPRNVRFFLKSVPVLIGLVLLGTPPVQADLHPNTAPGFPVEQSFHVGDIDNINLFNGALTLTIPLGGSYPVGAGFSYSLKLVYNSSPWVFTSLPGMFPDGTSAGTVNQASYFSDCSNAGLGWRVSLGRLNPPCQPDSTLEDPTLNIYQDENGTDHIFFPTLHQGDPEDVNPSGVSEILYTRDGSYLRLKKMTDGSSEIEFPDGTIRTFMGGQGPNAGLPTEIRDRFENHLKIDYPPLGPTRWVLSDNHGRTHTITFTSFGGDEVVSSVALQAFGGSSAEYSFEYAWTNVGFACPQNNPSLEDSFVMVPLLTKVKLPDQSYYEANVSDYITAASATTPQCTDFGGNLLRLTLPTGGRLEWTWQKYQFPTGSSVKPRLQTNDGVATRKMVGPGNSDLGTWKYEWATTPSTPLTAKEHTTTVTDPLRHKTVHYFSVANDLNAAGGTWSRYDYSLPFTWYQPLSGVPGMNLSRQVFNAAGTLLRSEYVQYERDPFASSDPPKSTNTNRRMLRSRTVYHDDGGLWTGMLYSGFDGMGHYRQRQTEAAGGFQGADRTSFANYNPARGTYTVNPAANTGSGYSVLPATSPWVLETMTYASESEGGQTAQTDFCYFPGSTVVTRKRTHRQNGATADSKDLISVFDVNGNGNVTLEKSYGGDVQAGIGAGDLCSLTLPAAPEYQIEHIWENGVRAKSKYSGLTFSAPNQTIDSGTGLVSESKDSAELGTKFTYDVLNRMTWAMPQSSNRTGFTEYVYDQADGGNPPTVTVRRRDAGGTGGTVLVTQFYEFDSFGRLVKEQRNLPTGGNNTRTTVYDKAGNKAKVSEVVFGSTSAPVTSYLDYDPFGRPATISPSDGSVHDVTLSYQGVRQVSRTVKIATNAGGGETTSTTTEIYDRHGRLVSVTEPSGSGGSAVTTTYGYDVGNRLTSVLSGSQSRSFVYDRAGLLLSETHPEKGASGNGSVTYSRYDSRGHARRKIDGPNDLGFTYDSAERLTQVNEWNGRPLKAFTYAPANTGANLKQGKLEKASRFNYLNVSGSDLTVAVDETYTYAGRDGAVSKRDTALQVTNSEGTVPRESFTQSFAYNTLGLPSSVTYPICTFSECIPPAAIFTDVPAGHPDQWQIEAIYRAGITGGCSTSPPQYCPDSNVTRAQMAVFLILAVSGPTFTPPPASCTIFQDVPCSHWAVAWIEELYNRGLTSGCSATPRLYCPESPVSKAEMSVFLLRNREGLTYQPPPCVSSPFADVPCTHWAAPWILEANRQGIIPSATRRRGTTSARTTRRSPAPRWRATSPEASTCR